MARARTLVGFAPLLLGLLLQAAPSYADKTAPPAASDTAAQLAPKLELEGPEAEAKDRARELFKEGVAAYRAGRYYEAVDIFLETQRIYPDTQLCFNVARAYENLGNTVAALRYYRDYLRQADRPSDGEEVRQRVRKLEEQLALKGVQLLTVLSQPEGATVLLDGRPVGITPWNGETYAGKHRLALALARHVPSEQVVELDAHTARDVSLVLLPAAESAPAPTVIVREMPEKRPGVSLPTLLTLGSGLLLLGGAVVAEAVSSDAGMSRTSAFFAGSGMGVSSVGGVMLYFDLAPSRSTPRLAPLREKDSAAARP
jgi:tetratricopeptide (TPR) repeat protein